MRIGVLGTVHIITAQSYADVGSGQVRRALAILACNANRTVDDDKLVDAIWDETPPRTAMANLRGFISKLRNMLDPEVQIERRPGGYLLRASADQLDAARFERLADLARKAAFRKQHLRARDLSGQALGLWRGPAYGDLAELTALQDEAKRLEQRRLSAQEEYFDAKIALGQHADVIGELRDVVARHPFRDRIIAQLMIALYRSGRKEEAVEVFRSASLCYATELGLPPAPELVQLQWAILDCDGRIIATTLERMAQLARHR